MSLWDWGTPIDGRADNAATDKRNPTVNANGTVYGVSQMNDAARWISTRRRTASLVKVPTNAPPIKPTQRRRSPGPNNLEALGRSAQRRHRPQGPRVVDAADPRERHSRPGATAHGANSFGKYYPLASHGKQVANYDPKTQQVRASTPASTSTTTSSATTTSSTTAANDLVGWVDMDVWDKTHDAEKSQGWCPAVIDTNGDGKITRGLDRARSAGRSGEGSPPEVRLLLDRRQREGRQHLVLVERRRPEEADPHREGTESAGNLPGGDLRAAGQPGTAAARGHRRSGRRQQRRPLAGWRVSGHFTAFDRSKCKSTKDPKADGQSCPEGWTIYRNEHEPTYANSEYKSGESYLITWTRTTRSGSARRRRSTIDQHRLAGGLLVGDQAVRDAARAVSHELLRPLGARAASTIRRRAGRARASGPVMRPMRHGTSRAARARCRRP